MLTPDIVEKRYERLLCFNMLFALTCFLVAVEKYFLILPMALIIVTGYLLNKNLIKKSYEAVLALLLVVLFVAIYVGSNGDALFAGGNVLIGIYLTFFLREKSCRKSPINLLTVLGLMILSTFLIDRFYYVFFFIPFAFIHIRLLVYALIYRELLNPVPATIMKSSPSGRLRRQTGKFILCSVGLAIITIIFILIPRTNWEFKASRNMSIGRIGFSKKMDSSSISKLLSDPNVFFTVQTRHTGEYFKGVVYDEYQKTKWETTLPMKKLMRKRNRAEIVLKDPPTGKLETEIYTIFHYQGKCIFYRKAPYLVRFRNKNQNRLIKIDRAGNINSLYNMRKRMVYFVTTSGRPKEFEKPTEKELKWVKDHFLQLPNISKRVKDLAKNLTKNAKNDYEKTSAIYSHLRENYPYTLKMSPGKNEISDYFLFEAKKGYCIHFATTMAIMLRTVGVPTRVIGGFRSDNYETEDRHYIVTNEDAHAWVEVYLSDRGWTFFDPTPPQADYLAGLEFWKRAYYKLHMMWTRNVVGFSKFHQSEIFALIKQGAKWYIQTPIAWLTTIALILLISFRKHLRLPKLSFFSKNKKSSEMETINVQPQEIKEANHFYQKMIHIIAKLRVNRAPQETPYEFENKIQRLLPNVYSHVHFITRAYCDVRFGHQKLQQDKKDLVNENMDKLSVRVKEIQEEEKKEEKKKVG